MVYARHSVGGRRSLEEYEFRSAISQLQRFLKRTVGLPSFENLVPDGDQIKPLIFPEFHIIYFFYSKYYGSL